MAHKIRNNEDFKAEKTYFMNFFLKIRSFYRFILRFSAKRNIFYICKKHFKSIRSPVFCNHCKTKRKKIFEKHTFKV